MIRTRALNIAQFLLKCWETEMKLNLDYKMILSIITVLVSQLKQFPQDPAHLISSTTDKFSKLVKSVGSVCSQLDCV